MCSRSFQKDVTDEDLDLTKKQLEDLEEVIALLQGKGGVLRACSKHQALPCALAIFLFDMIPFVRYIQ